MPSDIAALELLSRTIFWAYMIAAVGVILGVYWENEDFAKRRRHLGWLLLLLALGIETAQTVGLHAVDDEISSRQKAEIIRLYTQLSPRLLTDEQRRLITARMTPFSDVNFGFSVGNSEEERNLAISIAEALTAAGWKHVGVKGALSMSGIQVQNLHPDLFPAAASLVGALKDVDLGYVRMDPKAGPEMEKYANPRVIIIMIGPRPRLKHRPNI